MVARPWCPFSPRSGSGPGGTAVGRAAGRVPATALGPSHYAPLTEPQRGAALFQGHTAVRLLGLCFISGTAYAAPAPLPGTVLCFPTLASVQVPLPWNPGPPVTLLPLSP